MPISQHFGYRLQSPSYSSFWPFKPLPKTATSECAFSMSFSCSAVPVISISEMRSFPNWSLSGNNIAPRPTAYAKSQKTYEVVCRGDEKWGSGSPFFQKTSVISTRLIHKNVKSIAGSKGLSPLAGFGAEPQKNFAYTVGLMGRFG